MKRESWGRVWMAKEWGERGGEEGGEQKEPVWKGKRGDRRRGEKENEEKRRRRRLLN